MTDLLRTYSAPAVDAAQELLESHGKHLADHHDAEARERYFAAIRTFRAARGPRAGDELVSIAEGAPADMGRPLCRVLRVAEKTAVVVTYYGNRELRVPVDGLVLAAGDALLDMARDELELAGVVAGEELAELEQLVDLELELEEDQLPDDYCGSCLGTNRVRFDHASGRRLCVECEPNPELDEVVVIPCGGRKLDRPAPAAELYVGSYFAAALRAARAVVDGDDSRIRVLSGRYGFVKLSDELEPYEQRIDAAGAVTADELARQVAADELLLDVAEGRRSAHLFVGHAYAVPASGALGDWARWPMQLANARGIGDHLRYFGQIAGS